MDPVAHLLTPHNDLGARPRRAGSRRPPRDPRRSQRRPGSPAPARPRGPQTPVTPPPSASSGGPRQFRRLWASAGASNLTDGVLLAGLPVLAVSLTTSPLAIAGVTVAVLGPMTLSALPAGAIADRGHHRRLLVLGNLARAVGLVGVLLAALGGAWGLAAVYLAAVVAGSTEVLVDTTAQTATTDLLPPERWDAANARLVGTQLVGNQAVGAPIGAAVAALGAGWLLGASAVGYLVAAALVWRVPGLRRSAPRGPRAGLRREIAEGITFLRGVPVLARLAVAAAVANLGNTAFGAIAVLVVTERLGLPAAAFGLFGALLAVGGIVGALGAERWLRRVGYGRALRLDFAAAAAALAVIGLSRHVVVVAGAVAVLGATVMITNVAARSLRQVVTGPAVLGRVTATMAALALVATPIGGLLGGAVGELAGLSAACLVAAALQAGVVWLLRPVGPRAIAAARAAAERGRG